MALLTVGCVALSSGAAQALVRVVSGVLVGVVDQRVQAIFTAYPNGGPDMTAAIAELLTSVPSLAADVLLAARRGSTAQASAAGAGYAKAQVATGSAEMESLAQYGSPAFQSAYTVASLGASPNIYVGPYRGSQQLPTSFDQDSSGN